jgi:hypothetical protein
MPGEGLMALFGYPQAHEHGAERAVQAGLAIVEAAGTTSTYSIRRTSRAAWHVHGDRLPVQD